MPRSVQPQPLQPSAPYKAFDAREAAPTYEVRTLGCQMNAHDSERITGLLETAGYVPAVGREPDLVVFNTCAVRENADNKL